MSPSRVARSAFRVGPLALSTTILVASGCQHVGQQSTARTLDAFQSRVSVAVGASTWIEGDVISPGAAVQARLQYGLSDHVEVGLSGGSDGLGVMTKVALIRSASDLSGLNLAIEPSVSAGTADNTTLATARLPLLFGYRFGGHEVTLGPRVHYAWAAGSERLAGGLYAGATLGMRIKTGPHFIISPEIGWLQPLTRDSHPLVPIVNLGFSWE